MLNGSGKTRKYGYGFSLVELSVALALSSTILLAAITAHSQLWASAWQGQQQMREEQSFYALAHWVMRDVRRVLSEAEYESAAARFANQCLLYGDHGVRVRNGVLQWRPNQADCESLGWLALHDPQGFKVTHLKFTSLSARDYQLCVSGAAKQKTQHMQKEQAEMHWCYLFRIGSL
ncbi:MAG: prepilin-type N-terminal cleavage/methylation domain-containing protein [Idiomarina sp.]|nr:prepilin-type N-terminal cleavage/methylation domain-containing protein [Idiomarina sp.]